MKNIIILFFLCINSISLWGCKETQNTVPIDTLKEWTSLTKAEFEETTIIDDIEIHKKTLIDLETGYFYSVMFDQNNSNYHYLSYQDNSFYHIVDSVAKIFNYKKSSSVLDYLGIGFVFEEKEYNFEANKCRFAVFGYNLNDLFNLLECELNNNIKANKNAMIYITIINDNNQINYIDIDFSNCFLSNYKNIVKRIKLKGNNFEEVNQPLYDNVKDLNFSKGETLEMYVLEMNYQYGDAIFFKSGNFEMLIDSGQFEDGPYVNDFINEYCEDNILEVLVATHHHADHIGGFYNGALDGINSVGFILDYGYKFRGNNFAANYLNIVDYYTKKTSDKAFYASAYDSINYLNGAYKTYRFAEEFTLEVLNTGQYLPTSVINSSANPNDNSVVFILTFGNTTYFLNGDLSGYGDANLIKNKEAREVSVYKAAHHGAVSNNSNSADLLNILNPKVAVVSTASFGTTLAYTQDHPREPVIARLLATKYLKESKNLYVNTTMGTINVSSDGINEPTVKGFGATVGYTYQGVQVSGEANMKYVDTTLYKIRNGIIRP